VSKHRPSSTVWISRPEHHPTDSVKHECSKTHHARLERCVARHRSALRPKIVWDGTQGFDFGVLPRVELRRQDGASTLRDDSVVQRNHRTDWQISAALGLTRELDSPHQHPAIVQFHIRIRGAPLSPNERDQRTLLHD
jgi:hypothetical protein